MDSKNEAEKPRESRTIDDLDSLLPLECRGAELLVAQTDLCPALIVRARSRTVRIFCDLDRWGLGGPTHLAVPTGGNRHTILPAGGAEGVIDGSRQNEPWLLAWFEGAPGWDKLRYGQPCHWRGRHPEKPFPHIDVPWLVVLQRKTERLELTADALMLRFGSDPGTIVLMPLYGVDLKPVEETHAWRSGLPEQVVERCRRWSRYLRKIPVNCREAFTIKNAPTASFHEVKIEQRFDYLAAEDQWDTDAEYIAPYPPFIRLAAKRSPCVRLDGVRTGTRRGSTEHPSPNAPGEDEIATPAGPFWFRRDSQTSGYDIAFDRGYIRQELRFPDAPVSQAAERAVERLRTALENDPKLPAKTSGGFSRGLALALESYARALPYLAGDRKPAIRKIMDELVAQLLDPSRYVSTIRYSTATDVEPVGEAICQRTRDAYKVVQANFHGLWAAANASGDWERLRQAWPLVRRWFQLPFQTQWLSPLPVRWEGLDIARASFDGTIGFARIAAQLGEIDDYRAACHLFAKVCAGWFAMETMPQYHREHTPWLVNTDADYLVWHPCRINGYVAIANDHLLPHEDPRIDSRGWASAYGRQTPSTARFWRDHLKHRADEVLNGLLSRCRPDWARAGTSAVVRSYVFGESAGQLEDYRTAHESAERAAAGETFRLRTYRLFQSTPVLREIAAIEAGATPQRVDVIPETEDMEREQEGAGRTACREDHAPIPCRIAAAEETGGFPLLYWPGIRTPDKAFSIYDKRLDVLPFGTIRTDEPDIAEHGFSKSEIVHPNWCLSVFTHHRDVFGTAAPGCANLETDRRPDGSIAVTWSTPVPADSIIQYWRHEFDERRRTIEIVKNGDRVEDHGIIVPPLPEEEIYWFRALSFDESGRLHRSEPRKLPSGRVNRALGCTAYASRPFPFKVHKFASDRESWLAEYHARPPEWQLLKPPHELTDGRGLRPGVEPWIRHAEPDPQYRHWVAVDLGRPCAVDEVIVVHDPGWVSAGFRIDTGPGDAAWSAVLADPDGPAWSERLAEETENRIAVARHRFECREIRWVRILYTHPAPVGIDANRLILWEIEVRGPSDARKSASK